MRSTNAAMQPLLDTVSGLWPNSQDTEAARPSAADAGNREGDVEFFVVPNAQSPRMLIPGANARAAAGSLRRYNAAISLRETLQRLGLAAALQSGMASTVLRDRVSVGHTDDENIVSYLSRVFSEPVSVSLTIGPARANRKPVLQVFDSKGRSKAFVKVGDSAPAVSHVAREAQSLRELGAKNFPTLAVPSLIHFGHWEHRVVLVMSALQTSPMARPVGFDRLRNRGLHELAQSFHHPPARLADISMWARLELTAGSLTSGTAGTLFADCLHRVAHLFGDRMVSVGAWHGDCSPWNMAAYGRRLHVWDWERFETGVLVGMDAIHYALNRHLRAAPLSIDSVFAGLRRGAPRFKRSDSDDAVVTAAYVASITARYLAGAEGAGGENISEKSQIMLAVLDRLTSQWQRTAHA